MLNRGRAGELNYRHIHNIPRFKFDSTKKVRLTSRFWMGTAYHRPMREEYRLNSTLHLGMIMLLCIASLKPGSLLNYI